MLSVGKSHEVIDREASLALLATVPVGRIAMSVNSLPVIVPVGFCLDGSNVVFAVEEHDGLAERVHGAIVAFQADMFDPTGQSGWSVLVQGPARLVDDNSDAGRLRAFMFGGCVTPQGEVPAGHALVSVATEVISGRRIGTPASTSFM